jgi:uroporphyrinogen-III synthase
MTSPLPANLQGLRVLSFESRRAKEMAELIRRYGGEPMVAPSMREVPLGENHAVLDFLPEIEAGQFDMIILMTGIGTRTLYQMLLTRYPEERVLAALQKSYLVARGPKPVAALKELGLTVGLTVPEPNTWREVLQTLDANGSITGKRVAVQEYGIANPELVAGLEQRGASVKSIAIYRWALPEDLAPLRDAIRIIAQGSADVALFTNGAQVEHLFRVAVEDNGESKFAQACKQLVIGSVGPICTMVLKKFGLEPDIEPAHPKMGSLIAEVAAAAQRIAIAKRSV